MSSPPSFETFETGQPSRFPRIKGRLNSHPPPPSLIPDNHHRQLFPRDTSASVNWSQPRERNREFSAKSLGEFSISRSVLPLLLLREGKNRNIEFEFLKEEERSIFSVDFWKCVRKAKNKNKRSRKCSFINGGGEGERRVVFEIFASHESEWCAFDRIATSLLPIICRSEYFREGWRAIASWNWRNSLL